MKMEIPKTVISTRRMGVNVVSWFEREKKISNQMDGFVTSGI
jgi:hypothetical protein